MNRILYNLSVCFSLSAIAQAQPTMPWTYVNTGISHTIIITTAANPDIGGVALTNGDYIGVFYDLNGTLTCGGYEMWTGSSLAVAALGDDATTSAKDGFANNEVLKWKIWRHSDGKVLIASPGYSPVGSMFGYITHTNRYGTNGISDLSALSGGTILVDGDLSDLPYAPIAEKQNSRKILL